MLTLICLSLALLFFYFGFIRPPAVWGYRLRAGFVVMLGLTFLSGYFTWREYRSIHELEGLIDPVPGIVEVQYVPTTGEMQAIADLAASVPGRGRFGASTQEERRRFADSLNLDSTRYWILKTSLTLEEILAFYRDPSHRRGWSVEADHPPWLLLSRGTERLTLFFRETWTEREVLYIHDP